MEWNDSLSSYLAKRSQRSLLLLTAVAICVIWLFDYFSGPRLSVSIFYLLPVGLASWYVSGKAGLLVAISCAVAWLFNDLVTNPSGPQSLLPFWNAGVRLATFLLVAYSLLSLRRARRRQEDLVTFVIHDLRAPLANILGSMEMIQHINSAHGSDTTEQFVDLGLSSGNSMMLLIDSLLDLARLESGRMPVDLQPVLVNPLLREAIQQVSALTVRQEVHIELLTAHEMQAAWADRALLGRVLINLLSNALRFSPKDSTISVEARPISGGWLQIVISDQGPGIPSKWRRKAFEKYRQVQGRKEGSEVGSGLGLAFCRMAMEAQKGRIWLESAQPSGTSVHLTLPLHAEE